MVLEGIIGVGLCPVIRNAVGYFKPVWDKAGDRLRPVFTTLFACGFGTLVAYLLNIYTHGVQTLPEQMAIGVLSGFAAILYNDNRTEVEARVAAIKAQ